MSHLTIEAILFLKKNADLWDIRDGDAANRARLEDNKECRAENIIQYDGLVRKLLDEMGLEY